MTETKKPSHPPGPWTHDELGTISDANGHEIARGFYPGVLPILTAAPDLAGSLALLLVMTERIVDSSGCDPDRSRIDVTVIDGETLTFTLSAVMRKARRSLREADGREES